MLSARFGDSSGMNKPRVLLSFTRYSEAAFRTASAVTCSKPSRAKNIRRQSPIPIHSDNSRAMLCEEVKLNSTCFNNFALARATSSSVIGVPKSSRVLSRAVLVDSMSFSFPTSARKIATPGSPH